VAAAESPYLIPVHELVHRPGSLRERALDFPAPEQLGQGAAVVREGEPLAIELRLEGLHEGVLASGHVSTTAEGECVRCLDPLELEVEVDFQELFAYVPDEAYDFAVQDDRVDLEPVVRDAVVLALPFQPVCRPDCPGLDPATGERRAVPPAEDPAPTDPRWAALEGFRPEE